MTTLSCPSCGANVDFRSKSSVFAVCSFCKSTLIRHDMDLEMIGKMSEIQDELTPLQIGTTGDYNGRKFEIVGRLKVAYEDGFWNEWYALFPDSREAWLAEAQGFYALCFSVEGLEAPDPAEVKVGATLAIGAHGAFTVEDMREVQCQYSEGELPMNAAKGRASLSVDLTANDYQMGTIEYAADDVRVFIGGYVEFDDFKFSNLRKIDGW